ncbi:MAG TPA: hypothetical protein VGJ16_06550 [Pirellulales bacterium]|jgi:hypothetical protein
MTSYLHVLNTYAWRWRFWIFGGLYLFFAWASAEGLHGSRSAQSLGMNALQKLGVLYFTTIAATIVLAFFALHVRRQFGSPQAHVVPRFFGPHFTVFVATSSFVWLVIPWLMTQRSLLPVLPSISCHACAAILLGMVVVWPGAMVLLVPMFFAPLLLFGRLNGINHESQVRFAEHFVGGELQWLYFVLLALAALAYAAAGWRLQRLSDLSASTSDDFSLEVKPDAYTNRAGLTFLQTWRDRATESRLLATDKGRDSFRLRWIPSATSFPELAIVTLLILALMPTAWYLFGAHDAGFFVLTVGSAIMIFAPLSAWRFRLNALAPEVVMPATRRQAIRRVVLAMGLDFVLWGIAASLVIVCGYLFQVGQRGFSYLPVVTSHLLGLWGAIVMIFGVSLATLRFRYWVPLFLGMLPGAMVLCAYLAIVFATLIFPISYARRDDARYAATASIFFAASCTAVGLLVSGYSYRRLLEADLR